MGWGDREEVPDEAEGGARRAGDGPDGRDGGSPGGQKGGAEKRMRPQEREDRGAREREVRMRRRTQADRIYARLREGGETVAGDKDKAGRRWAGEASESCSEEEMDTAAESEGEEV